LIKGEIVISRLITYQWIGDNESIYVFETTRTFHFSKKNFSLFFSPSLVLSPSVITRTFITSPESGNLRPIQIPAAAPPRRPPLPENPNIRKIHKSPRIHSDHSKNTYFSVLNTDQTPKMLNQNQQIQTPKIKFLISTFFRNSNQKKIKLESSPPYHEHSTTIITNPKHLVHELGKK
jgi:hypothetical protein